MRSLQTAPAKNTLRVITKKKPTRNKKRTVRKEAALAAAPAPAEAAPPAVERNDVRRRAMLVNLAVHEWLANTTDARITDDVAKQHGIATDMGKYQKKLLSKSALERLRTAANKLRSTHKRLTLPWDEWGTRILSSQAYFLYNSDMRSLVNEYEQIVREELEAPGASGQSKYEEHKAEAKRLLNGAFREEDYPTLAQLKRKFRADIRIMPIPAGDDFRIELGAEATEEVRRQIEAQSKDRVTAAMEGLFERLKGMVEKLVAALKAEKTEAIRSTLFTSLAALLDTLPILNVTGDPNLARFAAEIVGLLDGASAKELRESEPLRAEKLQRADEILAKMNDFLG